MFLLETHICLQLQQKDLKSIENASHYMHQEQLPPELL